MLFILSVLGLFLFLYLLYNSGPSGFIFVSILGLGALVGGVYVLGFT